MDEKKKINIGDRNITHYNKQAFNYLLSGATYEAFTQFFGHLSEPKKVTDMVGTFSKDDSNGFQTSTTKTESKKVTNMEGTFLTNESYVAGLSEYDQRGST
ncbi:hypothetical protein [Emticicia sp. C21]|uniref:hypothetical protein n=1 Tax=Emticicia sp. C21 TaxID=2302915 RepID=UPI000E34FD3F|nr:hypothetical protein [Emticicia sp. C21]RFS13423.1 hypothetical protein D0T08_26745 [Emticicia sp. C21]